MPDTMISIAGDPQSTVSKEPPTFILLRELWKADREDSDALAAWEKEQSRVRAMYPPCPAGIPAESPAIGDGCGVDRRYVVGAERWVKAAIREGRLTRASLTAKAFRAWKAECDAIDVKHLNYDLQRARVEARERLADIDKHFQNAPVKSLADVRAKLDYVLRYEDFGDGGAKRVVRGMKRDIPRWEAVCW